MIRNAARQVDAGGELFVLVTCVGVVVGSVSHVIVIEPVRGPSKSSPIRLVADFRPDHARVAAVLSTPDSVIR